jgi:hypothetical protein
MKCSLFWQLSALAINRLYSADGQVIVYHLVIQRKNYNLSFFLPVSQMTTLKAGS